MKNVKARAAGSAKMHFEPIKINRRCLRANDILIEIKFAGICHSDIHTIRGEWGEVQYPLVPGHEIAGVVKKIGASVTGFHVGERVGVGCMVGSCGQCKPCRDGEEQYCEGPNGQIGTYADIDQFGDYTQGGYSTHIVVNENFAVRIPNNIPLEKAAPLLCAGITTYSPLKKWHASDKKIAVVGMGGLGHMAVKIASAMGAEVTVLSQGLSKKEDGFRFGAKSYYATSDPETFKQLKNTFDLMINTVSSVLDYDSYLDLVKLDGTFVNVGAPADPALLHISHLIMGRKSFTGSAIGGIKETQEMLDFCGEHFVTPEIELISADRIDEAYERILKSDIRYRFVIDAQTI